MKKIKSFEEFEKLNEELSKKNIMAILMSLAFLKPAQAQKIAATIEKKTPEAKQIILKKLPDVKTIKDINSIIYQDDTSTIKRQDIKQPKGYHPITIPQRKAWNEYLIYLDKKGLAGNAVLDEGDRGIEELEKYLTDNPDNPLNEFGNTVDLVKSIQYEMTVLRKGKTGFPGLKDDDLIIFQESLLRQRPAYMNLIPSEIDGKPGQLTTQLWYPAKTYKYETNKDPFDYSSQIEDVAFYLIDKHGIKYIDGIDLTSKLTPTTKQFLGSLYK